MAATVGRLQEVLDCARELSGVEPAGRAVQPLDHGEPGDFTPEVSVEELVVVVEGHAAVRLAVGAQHVGVGENAGAAVHPAVVDRVEADGANAVKQPLAQGERIDVRRRRALHPHVHVAGIVHHGAEAGMGLEPPATRQVDGTRGDVVDRGAAVVIDRREFPANRRGARPRPGDDRLCHRIGAGDGLVGRRAQAARQRFHRRLQIRVERLRAIVGRGETCLEGDGTISQRGETLLEGDATVSQRGETLLERRHGRWARARRSGAIGQHAHGVGRGVEADLRLQARHPDALAEMPGSERRAQPENVRMDGSEDGDRRTGQCGVRRTRLRPCRFEHEPYTYRGDSNRNHATPPSNQEVPHSLPTSPGVTASVNVRPPTRAGASTAIAARIVRRDGVAVISYLGPPTPPRRLLHGTANSGIRARVTRARV